MKRNSYQTLTVNGTEAAVDLGGRTLYAIQTPAGIASDTLTFQVAPTSDGTYANVYDDADQQISVPLAESRFISFLNQHITLRPLTFTKLIFSDNETNKQFTLYFVDE